MSCMGKFFGEKGSWKNMENKGKVNKLYSTGCIYFKENVFCRFTIGVCKTIMEWRKRFQKLRISVEQRLSMVPYAVGIFEWYFLGVSAAYGGLAYYDASEWH